MSMITKLWVITLPTVQSWVHELSENTGEFTHIHKVSSIQEDSCSNVSDGVLIPVLKFRYTLKYSETSCRALIPELEIYRAVLSCFYTLQQIKH